MRAGIFSDVRHTISVAIRQHHDRIAELGGADLTRRGGRQEVASGNCDGKRDIEIRHTQRVRGDCGDAQPLLSLAVARGIRHRAGIEVQLKGSVRYAPQRSPDLCRVCASDSAYRNRRKCGRVADPIVDGVIRYASRPTVNTQTAIGVD